MLIDTLSEIRVAGRTGRPRSRPDRLLADKGCPSKANRAWLREHDIAAAIPEREDQIAHRRKRPGRPIDFGHQQRERYTGRNVVERCFNKLKQWRGIAMRSDKTAQNYHSALCLAATLHPVASCQDARVVGVVDSCEDARGLARKSLWACPQVVDG